MNVGELYEFLRTVLSDISLFAEHASRLRLRGYQAQIEAYLLVLLSRSDAEIVKVSPTYKPQTLNAMRRLERTLARNLLTHELSWCKESGYIYRVGKARAVFLSGSPTANVVGATASTLLECDEAQDVLIAKWDKDFAPMAASTNATRVFWGTAWTSNTLLARELRLAQAAEQADGIPRIFRMDAADVAREVPEYARFVEEQVRRLGRQHPLVRTQYFSEEIDGKSGMFPERRLALLSGCHPRLSGPRPGQVYALLVDVAGEDEGLGVGPSGIAAETDSLANPRRDSTALTVVEVDLRGLADPLVRAPAYKIVDRRAWTGVKHAALYGQIVALAGHWGARSLVVDATGVGAGLASFLDKALTGRVVPFVFNAATKSKLGWELISLAETGRLKDYAQEPGKQVDAEQAEFIAQLKACQMEIIPGPERHMRWGVPEGRRDLETGAWLHDDWILSAALAAVLDGQVWSSPAPALVVPRPDPLEEMDREGY